MRKRLISKFTRAREGSLGYTLTELLVVVAIIAIVCAIAIPMFLTLRESLRFKQANDYAQSIFLAAQQNLSEMRANSGLSPLQDPAAKQFLDTQKPGCDFEEQFEAEYAYVSSGDENLRYFDLVLPAGSIDGTVRAEQIVIEFNPLTGNVYAVFFCQEEDTPLREMYRGGAIDRADEESRKEAMIGYYQGSGLNSSSIVLDDSRVQLTYYNGQEGIVEVRVPVPELFHENYLEYVADLSVELTITGQQSSQLVGDSYKPLTITLPKGSFDVYQELAYENEKSRLETSYGERSGDDSRFETSENDNIDADSGQMLVIPYVLDSLQNHMSFANLAAGVTDKSLTTIAGEDGFTTVTTGTNAGTTQLLPGENLDITATITYENLDKSLVLEYQTGILADVNPLFGALGAGSETGKYIIYLENGRHLQNLNALAPSIAENVESVNFQNSIHWPKTVGYYDEVHGTATGAAEVKQYQNNADEAPARALPYFVPIHHENLFGTARFAYPTGTNDGGLGQFFEDLLAWFFGTYAERAKVPSLTDELDVQIVSGTAVPNAHAVIQGNGHSVVGLEINSNSYTPFTTNQGRFYAMGPNQVNDYNFTGLFGYANTTINSLNVVNPVVRGREFETQTLYVPNYKNGSLDTTTPYISLTQDNNPATGSLLGAGGFNTLITNCGAYIDRSAYGFVNMYNQYTNFKNDGGIWYGVKGEGAVGGLVGFCKSHKKINETLTYEQIKEREEEVMAFSGCFAAVNVRGEMRGNMTKYYGYTNGVGGLLGNSQLTNFFNCYASGDVIANGCYVGEKVAVSSLIPMKMPYNGHQGMGAGGFVGTSHGTHYTNCFSTGSVTGTVSSASTANLGAGGFVGFMSVDEFATYKNTSGKDDNYEQHTIFSYCYSVGQTSIRRPNGTFYASEAFAGATGRIARSGSTALTDFYSNYYLLYAPLAADQYERGSLKALNAFTGPDYEDNYVFRDSYYLPSYSNDDVSEQYSKACAEALLYDDFRALVSRHNDTTEEGWIESKINAIKVLKIDNGYISGTLENLVEDWLSDFLGSLIGSFLPSYDDAYFESADDNDNNAMTKKFMTAFQYGYDEAFWQDTGGVRVSYRNSGTFPFTKLSSLDYYGDWPSRPSAIGMAYYEVYADAPDQTHYIFDRERQADDEDDEANQDASVILNLRNDAAAMVIEDGYVIFSADAANTPKISVDNGATWKNLTEEIGTCSVGGEPYEVFAIPENLLENAMTEGSYYVTVLVQQDGESYTMYVNPYVAQSHINPELNDSGHFTPDMPDRAPEVLSIRSARQFAGISKLTACFDEKTTFLQELNIDATRYDWQFDGYTDKDPVPALATIGSTASPFNATYKSGVTRAVENTDRMEVTQAQLKGFVPPAAGFFGVISEKGSVQELAITVAAAQRTDTNPTGVLQLGSANLDNVGVVAGEARGELLNVDLKVEGSVAITANVNAGLLAGYATGVVNDCQVVGTDVTLKAIHAGGYIGLMEKQAVQTAGSGSTEDVTDPSEPPRETVPAEDGQDNNTDSDVQVSYLRSLVSRGILQLSGGITVQTTEPVLQENNAFYAGGVFGRISDVDVQEGVWAELQSFTMNLTPMTAQPPEGEEDKTTIITAAGGLAGRAENSVFPMVTVTLTGEARNDSGILAGAFGSAEKVTLTDGKFQVSGITAKQAACLLGDIRTTTVAGCTLNLGATKTIQGTEAAAGLVYVLGPQSSINNVPLNLDGAAISASDGKAAGYAHTVSGEATIVSCPVTMSAAPAGENAPVTTISGTEAAGYALSVGGSIQSSELQGHGTILGRDLAAGYALNILDRGHISGSGVSPAIIDPNAKDERTDATGNTLTPEQIAYLQTDNGDLVIRTEAGNAAGFALNIGANATIRNCHVLGTIEAGAPGTAYGFAGSMGKDSRLETSTANVNLNDGAAFLGQNSGVVARCYGWYRNTDTDAEISTVAQIENKGSTVSSYFVNIKANSALSKGVTLYSATGKMETMTATQLSTDGLGKLSGEDSDGKALFVWYDPTAYRAAPYDGELLAEHYSFPMLRMHYGDWVTPPTYASGVAYYEKYDDNTMKLHLLDQSNGDDTEEGGSISGYYTVTELDGIRAELPEMSVDTVFDAAGVIVEEGYYRFSFYVEDTEEDSGAFSLQAEDAPEAELQLILTRSYGEGDEAAQVSYGFYPMTAAPTVDADGNAIHVNPDFADALYVGSAPAEDTYLIRTERHLGNIGNTNYNFKQTHDVHVETLEESANIAAQRSYDATGFELCICGEMKVPVFGTVDGTVTLQDVLLRDGGTMEALARTVNNSLTVLGKVEGEAETSLKSLIGTVKGQVTIHGDVDVQTASDAVLFGDVSGSVDVKNIQLDTVKNVFGAVDGTVLVDTVTANEVTGQVFGNSSGTIGSAERPVSVEIQSSAPVVFGSVGNANVQSVRAKYVGQQVFGNVTGNVKVASIGVTDANPALQVFGSVTDGSVTVTGDLSFPGGVSQVFGDVSGTVEVQAIATGDAKQIFGNVTSGSVTAASIQTGAVEQFFGSVQGNVTVGTEEQGTAIQGSLKNQEHVHAFGDVATGANLQLIGQLEITSNAVNSIFNSANGTVNADAITIHGDALQLFGKLTNAHVTTGVITVENIGCLAAAVEQSTFHPGNFTATGVVASDLIGAVNGGTVETGTIKLEQDTTGSIFTTITNAAKVSTGTVNVAGIKALVGNVENSTFHPGSFTATGVVVSNLIGTVNGGTVETGTIKLEEDTTGSIFTGITNAVKVSTVTVNVAGINALVGNVENSTFHPGSFTATGVVASDLIGAVNGGTVTTGTITLKGGLEAGLITGITGATVTLDDVTVTAEAVPTLFGAVSGTLQGKAEGSTITLTGATAQSLIASVSENAVVAKLSFTGLSKTSGALVSGDMAGTLNQVSLNAGTAEITLEDVSGLLVNTNGGTIQNCVIDVPTVAVSGSGTFGSVAGVNGGTIQDGSVHAAITYTQGETDEVIIGGLVGQMQSGTITSTKNEPMAQGSIALATGETAADRSHIVGGAIGSLTGTENAIVEIANVKVLMTVASAWDGVASVNSDNAMFVKGEDRIDGFPVGMFVGYAEHAKLNSCSNLQEGNTFFQFLGEAKVDWTDFTEATWQGDESVSDTLYAYDDETPIYQAHKPNGDVVELTEAESYAYITADLTDCLFSINGQELEQLCGSGTYYYELTGTETRNYYTADLKTSYEAEFIGDSSVTFGDLIQSNGTKETEYFVKTSDGYHRMTIQRQTLGILWFTYTTYTVTWENGGSYEFGDWQNDYSNKPVEANLVSKSNGVVEGIYTLSWPDGLENSGLYLLVQGTTALKKDNTTVDIDSELLDCFDARHDLHAAIWSGSEITLDAEADFYEGAPVLTSKGYAVHPVTVLDETYEACTFALCQDGNFTRQYVTYVEPTKVVEEAAPAEEASASWWDRFVALWTKDEEGA